MTTIGIKIFSLPKYVISEKNILVTVLFNLSCKNSINFVLKFFKGSLYNISVIITIRKYDVIIIIFV